MAIRNIGLALSGGGYRAAVYHMGVLARLAESNLLEEVCAVSTVSGGTLGAGLILSLNDLHWPTSSQYPDVLSRARERLTTQDLQSDLIWRLIYSLFTWNWGTLLTRASDLSQLLRKRWGVIANVSQLPDTPRWYINATCYESGKDWRFEKASVGDYLFGYTHQTNTIPISDAMAASSGFPGLVGALPFNTRNYQWSHPAQAAGAPAASDDWLDPAQYPTLHLWDGGVYDNNGLEVFHNFDRPHWQAGVEFLVASDASGKSQAESYRPGLPALFRIITGVMMGQIRALRARAVVALMRHPQTQAPGVYLSISSTSRQILTDANLSAAVMAGVEADCLPPDQVKQAANLMVEIRRLTTQEFRLLFRHGFETADCMLLAHHPADFSHIAYGGTRWPSIVP